MVTSTLHGAVSLARDGMPVGDADVSVDGQLLAPSADLVGYYFGALEFSIEPGQPVALAVNWHGLSVVGSGVMPPAPTVTMPVEAAVVPAAATLTVTWTCDVNPDRFVVTANWECPTGCLELFSQSAPGTERSLTIPGGKLSAGRQVSIMVSAYNDGLLEGDYAPLPRGMNIVAMSGRVGIVSE